VCVAILRYSAAGLAFAHERKIVHRDIKPANILVDKDGRVMVSDFGIARALEEVSMTASGMMIGTPYYMSPEQLVGEKLDERSDIFSIGLILYYCLTGDDLFRTDGVTAIMAKHSTIQIREVVATHALLPANLQDVLVSMMEEDRNIRARSVKEILERLTLRKIVALGLAATEDQPLPAVIEDSPPMAAFAEAVPAEDSRLSAAAERRKARLRSLLDTF
jgi:serine/threonine-protein kinase